MGIPDSQRVGIWTSDADVNIGEGKMLYDPLEDDERLMGCYFRPELKTTNSAPPDEQPQRPTCQRPGGPLARQPGNVGNGRGRPGPQASQVQGARPQRAHGLLENSMGRGATGQASWSCPSGNRPGVGHP